MLQLVYVSSVRPGPATADLGAILATSRRNNTRDAITGLLYYNGRRFLQALEGPEDRVEATYARICGDPRHRAIVSLSRRPIAAREFGEWAMALHEGDADARLLDQIDTLAGAASPNIRALFESFARLRVAA